VIYTLDPHVLVDALHRGRAVRESAQRCLARREAREFGWTIVTRDTDLTVIRRAITGLKVVAPFPARP
jgi:hypothetical protein